jgi:alkanesulfonate monooxygenase SsuD/methylene tetrahydromethanopterin reductase-like flavin-dependent oxidoreductase (luciferase family)
MATETAKGFAVFAGVAPEIIRASAREAEALGYSSFWVNHPGPVDGLGSLAHAAAETRRLGLGVGVIPLHTRGPESIVDGVRQHALPPTRLLLGVGSPNPEALKRVRDGVAAIRAKLSTRVIVAALGP